MPSSKPTREWFRDWFGEEYLALYPHRDEEEARQAVDLYREVSSPQPGSRLLDLACGAVSRLGLYEGWWRRGEESGFSGSLWCVLCFTLGESQSHRQITAPHEL